MAHFYGSLKGARGEATRAGSIVSGITAHVRGWDVGVRVTGYDEDGCDTFDIVATLGSHDPSTVIFVGRVKRVVTETGEDIVFIPNGSAEDWPMFGAPVSAGLDRGTDEHV